jgi:hypothetical protein
MAVLVAERRKTAASTRATAVPIAYRFFRKIYGYFYREIHPLKNPFDAKQDLCKIPV